MCDKKRPYVIEARFEWNLGRTKVVWNVRNDSGTTATGFADSHADAMRDAAAFVEAMAQPRSGSVTGKTPLRIVCALKDARHEWFARED